jgi:hypothetical protein
MSRLISRCKAAPAAARRAFVGAFFALLLLVAAPGAHAQTTTVDYAALATGAKGEIVTAIGAAAPVVFVIMAIIVGVGLTMAWVRRAAH